MLLPGRRLRSMTFKPGLTGGVVLSLAVGMLFYFLTSHVIENDNEERFRNMARTGQYSINARIKSYTDVLRASASLFQTNEEITRDQFRSYVTGLDLSRYFPAIETINFVRWVKDEERDAFVERIRREDALANDGRPLFDITPPGRRDAYSVVLYVEPNPLWKHAFGIDLNAQPLVYKALMESRDSGLLANSGAPIKAMKLRNRVGLGMRLPIYHARVPLDTLEQRRAAYTGSVGIAFNVQRLVQGVLGELPVRNVRLTMFNKIESPAPAAATPQQLLFDSAATEANPPPALTALDPSRFYVVLPVDFNGRKWDAHFSVRKNELYRSSDETFLLMATVTGFTTTMLLYSLYYTLTSSRRRAIELAEGMTKELRESEARLQLSHENLRRLSAHGERIKESERKRIAREIHDDLGQNLLALRIDAQLLSSRTGEKHPHLHARAEGTLEQIDATINSVRQIINDLRPNVLDLGLNAAVGWQVAEFRRRTGIGCELVEHHTDIAVSDHSATALFRILQESLSNVTRHAQATWVQVDLRAEGSHVRMRVSDNGIGLPPERLRNASAFGLIGIEERVKILGGIFNLTRTLGGGTTIDVAIPPYLDGQEQADGMGEDAQAQPDYHTPA